MNDSLPHKNWKKCNWWFQDKCNDYGYCEHCNHWKDSKEVVEGHDGTIGRVIARERKEKGLGF